MPTPHPLADDWIQVLGDPAGTTGYSPSRYPRGRPSAQATGDGVPACAACDTQLRPAGDTAQSVTILVCPSCEVTVCIRVD